MRNALRGPGVLFLAIGGVSLAMMAVGCSKGSEGEGRTAVTEKGAVVGETRAGERDAAQRTSTGEREETIRAGQEVTSNREQRGERESTQGGRSSDGRNGERAITVRVTGTEGLPFAGRIGGAQELKRVAGSVPEEFEMPSAPGAVAVSVRKQQRGAGALGVEVIRGGEVVASKETSNQLGMVNVVWSSRESRRKGE